MKEKNKIARQNPFYLLGVLIVHGETRGVGFRLLKTVWVDFFWPQYKTRLLKGRSGVASIDHPLDEVIEFGTWPIKKYLSFVHLWWKSLGYLHKELGKEVIPDIKEFVVEMDVLYGVAGRVYDEIQTTTKRPRDVWKPHFMILRVFDPHFHCLPSLHVVIVLFNYIKYREISEKHKKTQPEIVEYVEYAYNEAKLITESVLIVKQHSINCIAASLAVIGYYYPDFNADAIQKFLDELFVEHQEKEKIESIRKYVFETYQVLMQEMETKECPEALIDFLKEYASQEAL